MGASCSPAKKCKVASPAGAGAQQQQQGQQALRAVGRSSSSCAERSGGLFAKGSSSLHAQAQFLQRLVRGPSLPMLFRFCATVRAHLR